MIADALKSLEGYANPWIYVVVFVVAVAECALFLGLVVPGETVMLVGGYFAWDGAANIVLLVALAIVGAAIGDSIGYEIGRRYGERLRDTWAGRKIGERRWKRAERFLDDHGKSSVFTARFVTGPKSIVPPLAGEASMPYPTFLLFNVAGAIVWGTGHVMIGYVAGPAFETVDRYLSYGTWAIVGILLVGGGGWWWYHRRHEDDDE